MTTAIQHLQSDEKVAQAHVGISPCIVRIRQNESWKCEKKMFLYALPRFQPLFRRGLHNTAPATKKNWGNRSLALATRHDDRIPNPEMTTVSQNIPKRLPREKSFKTTSKFTNTAPATKNHLWNYLSFRPTPAHVVATCKKYSACHTDEKVSDVLRLQAKPGSDPPRVPK